MKLIARRIVDKQILHVIKLWLGCGYVEDGEHKQSKRGTPQGGVISPLLANIYLNPVDQAFKRSGLGAIRNGSIHLIRYADDMLILAQRVKDQVQRANRFLRGWVGYFRLGNSGEALRDVKEYLNKRVRHVIQRRRGNAGYGRWWKNNLPVSLWHTWSLQ